MAEIAAVMAVVGTVVSAAGTLAAGQSAFEGKEFEARQFEMQGREERAAAQQEGFQIARQKRLALSRNAAVNAASGFSADDPGSLDLVGDIEAHGTLQEQIARFGGESRALGLKAQAEASRMSGRAARTASFFDAGSTIIGGFGSFFSKYGGGGPKSTGAPMELRPASLRYG